MSRLACFLVNNQGLMLALALQQPGCSHFLFKRMEKAEAEFKVLKEEADREVDERERQEAQATREAEAAGQAAPLKLEKGALVRINVGPFVNHTATVSDIDHDEENVDLSVII